MAYGTIKVDNITYTNAGSDTTVTVSGLATGSGFSGLTITGTISGATITGNVGEFTTLTAGVATITSGVFASGTASAPSVSFIGDANTGLYSPGADQVAISTGGTQRLSINANGTLSTSSASALAASFTGTGSAYVDTTNGTGIFRVQLLSNTPTIGAATNHSLVFTTNNTERMRLTSDGKLGLGTSTVGAKLHIASGSSGATPSVNADDLFVETNGNTGITIGGSTSSSCSIRFADSASSSAGGIYYDHSTDAFDFVTAGNNRLHIDGSGRVGIGTTSPLATLHLKSAAGTDQLRWTDDTNSTAFLSTGTASSRIYTNTSLAFGTGSATFSEKARIDSSGRLLVGTSSSFSAGDYSQYSKLQVLGNTAGTPTNGVLALGRSEAATTITAGEDLGIVTFTDNAGNEFGWILCEADGTAGSGDYPGRLVFSTTPSGSASPSERLRISQDGVVTIKNGAVAEIDTLADGATITPDLAASCNFTVSISGNRTIANPSNITAGQTGSIFIIQGTGSNTLSWGSYWDFPAGTAPTLSTASGAVDRVDYIVRTSTSIHTVFTANYS